MTYRVNIHGRLPGANEYITASRTNKYVGAKMKKEAQELVKWQIARLPKLRGKVEIAFKWIEPNARRDLDNVAFGKKFILDALQEMGKLDNDDRKHVVGFRDTFGIDKTDPRIELEIKEIEQ